MTGRVCRRHGTPYPLREWRGKLVEDNCPKCMEDVRAALTLARDKQHTSLGAVEAVMRQAAFAATEHRYDVTGDDVVERVATAVERHFVEKFGASIHRGPSRLVALGSMVGFNPLNLAETIVAALSASSVMGKKD
jgi:hypothetical protein